MHAAAQEAGAVPAWFDHLAVPSVEPCRSGYHAMCKVRTLKQMLQKIRGHRSYGKACRPPEKVKAEGPEKVD